MRRFRAQIFWSVAATAVIAGLVLAGGFVGGRASRALHQSVQEIRAERELHFEVRPFMPPVNVNFEVVSAPDVFLQSAVFQHHLYIAGAAGLSEYESNGTLLRQFLAGRELPSAPLVALAVGMLADSSAPQLILATAGEGILVFDGASFRQIYPADADARAVTAILPVSAGHLLIGTKKHGVLLYDGKQLRALHPTLSKIYVQALAGSEVDLWIGTLNRGVLHWHAGTSESFSEAQGLPDAQVQAIALVGEKTYVGTPLGVAEFDGGRFSRVLASGLMATALRVAGEYLLVGTEDQGVARIPLTPRRLGAHTQGSPAQGFHESSVELAPHLAEVQQFFATDDNVYVLTRNALLEVPAHGASWKEVLKPRSAVLSDRNISALAEDKNGQLWIGYFDRGLDVLPGASAAGAHAPVVHVEDAHVFCVNRIWADAKSGSVAVATANGLVWMGASGNQQQLLTHAEGLIASHVTDVVPYRDGLAIATPAGLTFLDAGGVRSMYAFHGLVNNHVYALAVSGDDLMVGTLGGLSVLDRGVVQANYTASASGLKQNWITAVVPVGNEWMVGSYGSGIMALDRAGHFHSFEIATADLEINPNAMLVTEQHVFAGTLGKGLYIYDRKGLRWSAVHDGLPSQNVTALAASEGYIYVGTDNGLVRIEERKIQP